MEIKIDLNTLLTIIECAHNERLEDEDGGYCCEILQLLEVKDFYTKQEQENCVFVEVDCELAEWYEDFLSNLN